MKTIEDKLLEAEALNDLMRGQLAGIKTDMRRWTKAIIVDENSNPEPIRDDTQLLTELERFLKMRGIRVETLDAASVVAGDCTVTINLKLPSMGFR